MIDINDSELLKIEKIDKWMQSQQRSRRDIDQFTKDIREKFNQAGFEVEVKVQETNQAEVYGFEIEINGRVGGSIFDPDKQVFEVTRNLLELPGQDKGFIPSKEGMAKLLDGTGLKHTGHKH